MTDDSHRDPELLGDYGAFGRWLRTPPGQASPDEWSSESGVPFRDWLRDDARRTQDAPLAAAIADVFRRAAKPLPPERRRPR